MTTTELQTIQDMVRRQAPAPTPQALAWDGQHLWMGSRDRRRIYEIDPISWKVIRELEAPGIPWAAVAGKDSVYFTVGEGTEDDRYVYRYETSEGFTRLFSCPDLTGSYLSFDGKDLYLSQWYKHRILQLDLNGQIRSEIDVGAEICGHCFVAGSIYVIRGTEKDGERWAIARLDRAENESWKIREIASVLFASRSLTFDGERFWSNHRAADEIISFRLPG